MLPGSRLHCCEPGCLSCSHPPCWDPWAVLQLVLLPHSLGQQERCCRTIVVLLLEKRRRCMHRVFLIYFLQACCHSSDVHSVLPCRRSQCHAGQGQGQGRGHSAPGGCPGPAGERGLLGAAKALVPARGGDPKAGVAPGFLSDTPWHLSKEFC